MSDFSTLSVTAVSTCAALLVLSGCASTMQHGYLQMPPELTPAGESVVEAPSADALAGCTKLGSLEGGHFIMVGHGSQERGYRHAQMPDVRNRAADMGGTHVVLTAVPWLSTEDDRDLTLSGVVQADVYKCFTVTPAPTTLSAGN
jgi:hypothetical protein